MLRRYQNPVSASAANQNNELVDGILETGVFEENFGASYLTPLISHERSLFSSSANGTFFEYNSFIRNILTTLSDQQQREAGDTLDMCRSVAMDLRTYLTKTRLRVNRATQPNEFNMAIDIRKLEEICNASNLLLSKLWKLISILGGKLQEQQITKHMLYGASAMAVLATATVLGAAAYGMRYGFNSEVNGVIETFVRGARSGSEAAFSCRTAVAVTDFKTMMQNLKELKTVFTEITDYLSKIQAYDGYLDEESKQEFLGYLKAAEEKLEIVVQTLATC